MQKLIKWTRIDAEDDNYEEAEGGGVATIGPSRSDLTSIGKSFLTFGAFNTYLVDLNFNFTKRHIQLLDVLEGVDSVFPISRYRFRIAIGVLFEEKAVIREAEEILFTEYFPEVTFKSEEIMEGLAEVLSPIFHNYTFYINTDNELTLAASIGPTNSYKDLLNTLSHHATFKGGSVFTENNFKNIIKS